jgi:hypothetical protein
LMAPQQRGHAVDGAVGSTRLSEDSK